MLAATLLLTGTAGCTPGLPTDPVPRAGRPVDIQPRQDIQVFLPAPQPGAGTDEIVADFLRAALGYGGGDDSDVARAYLTQDLASRWTPTDNVLVYRGDPQVVAGDGTTVSVKVEVAGRIDDLGHLAEEPAGTVTTQTFGLERVDGEWRIGDFPEGFGLWLSEADLERGFRASTLYYLEPSSGFFVPDERWLPRGDALPAAVARAQLAEPPAYLQGAVAPVPGVGMAVASVPVDSATQVATVNLQGARSSQDEDASRMLWAQLTRALVAVPGVTSVVVDVAGRSLTIPGLEPPATSRTDFGFRDADRTVELALLRVGEDLVQVDPTRYDLQDVGEAAEEEGLELPTVDQTWTGLAASTGLKDVAAVSRARDQLARWRDGRLHVNKGIGRALTEPSFERGGDLWVAGRSISTGQPRVWVLDEAELTGVARPIEVPWLQVHERVEGLRVSPDGARVAMVLGVTGGRSQRLVVAGIVRDSRGRAVSLAEPLTVAPPLVHVESARWATPTRLLAVGRTKEDTMLVPYEVPVGGWIKPLTAQPGLVDVVPVPIGSSYRPVVRTDDGRFHTAEGLAGWYDARNGDDLVIPGS